MRKFAVATGQRGRVAAGAGACRYRGARRRLLLGHGNVFEHVKGVTNVVSGYAGGSARDANYDGSARRGPATPRR